MRTTSTSRTTPIWSSPTSAAAPHAGDTVTGEAEWSGRYLVNPWKDGALVDLDDHPQTGPVLRAHHRRRREAGTSLASPERWYRTIDRVHPGLLERAKLLLPDIKASSTLSSTRGSYPHHNLYFVVSDRWDLEVLGGLLLSDIANLFVGPTA